MNNIMEYVKCRDDIFYFMEKYLKLELRGYQIDELVNINSIKNGNVLSVLGHRQSGITLINYVHLLWSALFGTGKSSIIVVRNVFSEHLVHTSIKKLYDIFALNWDANQTRYHMLPSTLTGCRIKFSNESIIMTSTYDRAIVETLGHRFDYMFFDEAFFYYHSSTVIENMRPCGNKSVITNSSLPILEHELELSFPIKSYPWYCNPSLTITWALSELNNSTNLSFNLMYGCFRG